MASISAEQIHARAEQIKSGLTEKLSRRQILRSEDKIQNILTGLSDEKIVMLDKLIDMQHGEDNSFYIDTYYSFISFVETLKDNNSPVLGRGVDLLKSYYSDTNMAKTHGYSSYLETILSNVNENNIRIMEELLKRHDGKKELLIKENYRDDTIVKPENNVIAIYQLNDILKTCKNSSKEVQDFLIEKIISRDDSFDTDYKGNLSFAEITNAADALKNDFESARKIYELADIKLSNLNGLVDKLEPLEPEVKDILIQELRNKKITSYVATRGLTKESLTKAIEIRDLLINNSIELDLCSFEAMIIGFAEISNPEIENAYKKFSDKEDCVRELTQLHESLVSEYEIKDFVIEKLKNAEDVMDISTLKLYCEMAHTKRSIATKILKKVDELGKEITNTAIKFIKYNGEMTPQEEKQFLTLIEKLKATDDKQRKMVDKIINHLSAKEFELINYMLDVKNPDEKSLYSLEYIKEFATNLDNNKYLTTNDTLLKKTVLPLNEIAGVLKLSNPDGTPLLDSTSMSKLIKDKNAVNILTREIPNDYKVDKNSLYNKHFLKFATNGELFGCKTFEEFKEYVKTCSNKAEAGKIMGQITKGTLDDFLNSVPIEMQQALIGKTGTFTAKDFDEAIQKIENNQTLKKIFYHIEKENTGILSEGVTSVGNSLLFTDKNMLAVYNNLTNQYKQSPQTFQRDYQVGINLFEIYKNKILEYIKSFPIETQKEVFGYLKTLDYNNLILSTHLAVMDLIGQSNLSAIMHNESATKIEQLVFKFLQQQQTLHPTIRFIVENIYKSNTLKDNEFKQFASVVTALQNSPDKLVELIKEASSGNKVDMEKLQQKLYKEVMTQVDENIEVKSDGINGWDKNYFPYIIGAMQSFDTAENKMLSGIIKSTAADGNYEKFLYDPQSENGKLNIETKKQYQQMNLDFNQWMKYDGKREFTFTPKAASIDNVIKSLSSDLKMLYSNPEIKNLLQKATLDSQIIFDGETLLHKSGKTPTSFELASYVDKLMAFTNQYGNQLKKANMLDVKDHFKIRSRALRQQISNTTPEKLSIQLWKRHPQHDLFMGHYCQCCISLDGINSKAIVHSLAHNVDNTIELRNSNNETVGKAKVLWLKNNETGEPMLLANGFEITGNFAFNEDIRTQFTEFMKDYSKAVAGKEVPILTGILPYQKIIIDDLQDYTANINLLGEFPNNTYHLDSFMELDGSSWPKDLDKPKDLKMKILYMPE